MHARLKLVELAQSFEAEVTIDNEEDKTAAADSVMGLLMLESAQGQICHHSRQRPTSTTALDAICHLIEDKFDEGE